jgi:hypothetical protein
MSMTLIVYSLAGGQLGTTNGDESSLSILGGTDRTPIAKCLLKGGLSGEIPADEVQGI